MKISKFDIFRYDLPLQSPLTIEETTTKNREGIIIQLTDEKGNFGWGEVSPLPGLSAETLEAAQEQILALRNSVTGTLVPASVEKLSGQFEKWLKPYTLSSSARFGFEMAVLNLLAAAKKIGVADLLGGYSHEKIYISGLLSGSNKEVVVKAQEMVKNGFRSLKLKVGHGTIEEDIERIMGVYKVTADKALLRIDVNRCWSYKYAVEIATAIGPAAAEYIEEPFSEIDRIPEFFQETMLPVALDESLREMPFDKVKKIEGVDVLVLKPTVMGGIEKTMAWMRNATKFGIEVSLSSSYETGLGLSMIAVLASQGKIVIAAGLDTLKYFKKDILKKDLSLEAGSIIIPTTPLAKNDLRMDMLVPLTHD